MPYICRRSAEICGRVAHCYRGSAKGNCVRETRGSHDRVSDGDRLLGCDSVSFGEQFPTFRRILVFSPSESSRPSISSWTRPCMKAV
jgi:hypothetical protein